MRNRYAGLLAPVGLWAACVILGGAAPAGRAPDGVRTIYFAARGADGAPVTDLTAAEMSVTVAKENRRIESVRLATTPIDVAIVVNDGGSGAFGVDIGSFLQDVLPYGRFSIRALAHWPVRLVDYTDDPRQLRTALLQMGNRARGGPFTYLVDGINEAATDLRRRHFARPVLLVLTTTGEPTDASGSDLAAMASAALGVLEASGASLHVVMLAPSYSVP